MKIILIDNNYRALSNNNTPSALYNKEPIVYTVPDTALLREGRPFFVPDFTEECTQRLALVVRICRLGHSISERFAHRYYDALTVGVCFAAEDRLRESRSEGLPRSIAVGFDGATAIGRFISVEELNGGIPGHSFYLTRNGEMTELKNTNDLRFTAEYVIAYVSRFYTLRQGDLLFLTITGKGQPAVIDTRLTGGIDGRELMSFNVK